MALPQLLQSVPQELYDKIYEHTFDTGNSTTASTTRATSTSLSQPMPHIVIDEDYVPPMQLRIHKQMRQDFRITYYNTTFIGYAPDMVSWFRSLIPQNRALVKSIQCWLIREGGRSRISPTQTGGFKTYGCELKDLGAKEVDYCLYKSCVSVHSYSKAGRCADM